MKFDSPMLCPYVWAFIKYFRLLERMQLLEGQMHVKWGEVQNGGRAMFTCTSTVAPLIGSTTSKLIAKQHSNLDFTKNKSKQHYNQTVLIKTPKNESVESKQKALEREH